MAEGGGAGGDSDVGVEGRGGPVSRDSHGRAGRSGEDSRESGVPIHEARLLDVPGPEAVSGQGVWPEQVQV